MALTERQKGFLFQDIDNIGLSIHLYPQSDEDIDCLESFLECFQEELDESHESAIEADYNSTCDIDHEYLYSSFELANKELQIIGA